MRTEGSEKYLTYVFNIKTLNGIHYARYKIVIGARPLLLVKKVKPVYSIAYNL